jgi:Zn-dependent protease
VNLLETDSFTLLSLLNETSLSHDANLFCPAWTTEEAERTLKCQYCGKNVDFPFQCSFCGMYYCDEHRLPENHNCPELWQAQVRRPSSQEKVYYPSDEERLSQTVSQPTFQYPFRVKRARWMSRTEMLHLTAGALIVMAVGLSWNSLGLEWIFNIFQDPVGALVSAALFTFIFLSHELAHKAVAKQYGLWAEFRISLLGAALTIMTIASPLIKIVSVGAVNIVGAADKKIIGITALAGPLTSIGLACVLLIFSFLVPSGLNDLLFNSASLAVWIAVFNLIPLSILDGAKVFWWNKTAWMISFAVAVALMLVTW